MIEFLQNAPVTGCAMIGSAIYTWVTSTGSASITASATSGGGYFSSFSRIVLLSFPIHTIPRSTTDAICVLVLLFHLRVLERHWGSARFFTFGFFPAVLSQILMPWLSPSFPKSAHPSAHALAFLTAKLNIWHWITILSAFTVRYYSDLPALGSSRLFGSISVTDKVFYYLVLMKLLFFPVIEQQQGRGNAEHMAAIKESTGILRTLLFVLLGTVSATLLTSDALANFSFFSENGRFMKWFKNVTSPLFGKSAIVVHVSPHQSAPAGMGGMGAMGGRNTTTTGNPRRAANLAAADLNDDDAAVMQEYYHYLQQTGQAHAVPQQARGRPPQRDESVTPIQPSASQHQAASAREAVSTIMALNLPSVSETDVMAALRVCNGNVDLAVSLLMEQH